MTFQSPRFYHAGRIKKISDIFFGRILDGRSMVFIFIPTYKVS